MKNFLLIITLFAFLQSAFLPVNLVLVCIIARSLIVQENSNYYLAFFGGLILSFLSQANLGYWPLVLLLVVKICHMISKLPISMTLFTTAIWGAILLTAVAFISNRVINSGFAVTPLIIDVVMLIPIYFLTRIWEDRYIVKRNGKLKV